MKNMIIGTAFLVALAAGWATSASAEPVQTTVSYADLDLRTTHGIKTLDTRLAAAVQRVCGSADAGLAGRAENAACRAGARRSYGRDRGTAIAVAQGLDQQAMLNLAH